MCLSVLAGSWTIWSTTWSWKSRTVRAGKATQLASIATDSTWLHSSCSATSRALTARSNPQVYNLYLSIYSSIWHDCFVKHWAAICHILFFSQLQDMWTGIWVGASALGTHEGQPQAWRNALRLPGLSLVVKLWFWFKVSRKTLTDPIILFSLIPQVCNYRSSFFSDVETHFRSAHENTKVMLCPFCLKVLRSGYIYMQHYMKHQVWCCIISPLL